MEPAIDTSKPHSARVYDYYLGGKDNFAADRETAQQAMQSWRAVRTAVRENRAFLSRAVQYLAGEAGIRQFLDIGTGLPTADNTHEVAQRVAPECRVVYVDNDPIVLAHGRALLDSTPQGATAYIEADAKDSELILREAAATLDLSQPVAVMMLAITHLIPDAEDPGRIVRQLMAAVAPGSYLAISAVTSDFETERVNQAAGEFNNMRVAAQITPRTRAAVSRFFDGLDFVDPGLVPISQWRAPADPAKSVTMYAGVGRKPG